MKIIVFDDDPTGSQTVHDCLLLLKWDYQTLLKGLNNQSNILFILVNTRSLRDYEAKNRLEEVCNMLKKVINNENFDKESFIFVSRGDSTLRGHNLLEPETLNTNLGPFDATFHIPAFLEGNRITKNGIHYVNDIPVHETIFAKDKIFGFQTSNIKNLLQQKSNYQLTNDQINNLILSDLELLEIEDNNVIYKKLMNLNNNQQVIVDVIEYSHLKKFVNVIQKIIPKKRFLFRTAASFISVISDIKNNNKDGRYFSQLRRKNSHDVPMSGLIIVGSYVHLSTLQLHRILEYQQCKPIEINVFKFSNIKDIPGEKQINIFLDDLLIQIRNCLNDGYTPVIYTSRDLKSFEDESEQIKFYNTLALFLASLISEIKLEIGYLIAKGGITSNTILSEGLGIDYVYLEGQILKGISLVSASLNENSSMLPIITFPGNIGDQFSLVKVWKIMENTI